MLDRLGTSLQTEMLLLGSLHTAQHLRERAIERAQSALERRGVLIFMMGRQERLRMPYGMRDGRLLRKQQEEDADEMRKAALFHTGWELQRPDSMRFRARRAQDGGLQCFVPAAAHGRSACRRSSIRWLAVGLVRK
jgi:hypothetical protein